MQNHFKISSLGLEIYKNDLPGVTWNKAQRFIEQLNDRWRLPTLQELAFIKKLRDIEVLRFPEKYFDFQDSYYWSNKEGEVTSTRTQGKDGRSIHAYFFDMAEGTSSHNKKSYDLRVRLVRDI